MHRAPGGLTIHIIPIEQRKGDGPPSRSEPFSSIRSTREDADRGANTTLQHAPLSQTNCRGRELIITVSLPQCHIPSSYSLQSLYRLYTLLAKLTGPVVSSFPLSYLGTLRSIKLFSHLPLWTTIYYRPSHYPPCKRGFSV